MPDLISSYDAALFDLDGVIYLGPEVIPDVPEAIDALHERGVRVGYVTNNAARAPQTVAQHLVELGIDATVEDVVTSVQAMMRVLTKELPSGAPVLAVGSDALIQALRDASFRPVSVDENPVAVVQGYHPGISWQLLEDGAVAIQRGAAWYVTNPDMTRPTERGITPGCGAQAAVVGACVEVTPTMAGKPYRPLLDETVRRLESSRPIFVGDRLDTDIAGAQVVGMDSLFVFTGAHGKYDLVAAPEDRRPTHIGYDVSALLRPAREISVAGDAVSCGRMRARLAAGVGILDTRPDSVESQLDAVWALLSLAWNHGADVSAGLEMCEDLR